ncbi:hypothetical protein BHYA_0053g00360 [Botrytis hyacinthi]|uniref:WSC domain-containing protein n=1 Tax=Botrytis hyacinthi TaxID=278943 RepID=A0A4Z1GWN7_9HELO|nr:hypothetical protein BHYA_0053g00360 [Botrytis hyacinthi]
MKYTPLSNFIFLTILFEITNASFNLNTSGPDWDYVAKDLANTTSQACITAYSADIDCDDALLGFVASERPTFKTTSTDFENTCTTTYFDSGIQEACTADGDAAYENVRGTPSEALVPVEIVAQVFQYALARYCSKWANGTYCYTTGFTGLASIFSCDDACAVQKFQTAHDYPGSAYLFHDYWLASMGKWWKVEFADGWKKLQQCGKAVESATLSLAMPMPTSKTSISSSGTSTMNSASGTGTGSSISSSAVVSAESSSPTVTIVAIKSGARKIGHSLGLAFLGMSYSMFFNIILKLFALCLLAGFSRQLPTLSIIFLSCRPLRTCTLITRCFQLMYSMLESIYV